MTNENANPQPVHPGPVSIVAAPPPARAGIPKIAILASLAAIFLALAVIFLGSRGHKGIPAGTILPIAAQAASLPLSDLVMSESTSLSGGKSTFIDGHIRNTGTQTVSAITVQVLFRNDLGLAPQVETLPLSLIRTHQPYVDAQPVAAAPLAPGDTREFRLIFENINSNWNVNLPEIHIVSVTAK